MTAETGNCFSLPRTRRGQTRTTAKGNGNIPDWHLGAGALAPGPQRKAVAVLHVLPVFMFFLFRFEQGRSIPRFPVPPSDVRPASEPLRALRVLHALPFPAFRSASRQRDPAEDARPRRSPSCPSFPSCSSFSGFQEMLPTRGTLHSINVIRMSSCRWRKRTSAGVDFHSGACRSRGTPGTS